MLHRLHSVINVPTKDFCLLKQRKSKLFGIEQQRVRKLLMSIFVHRRRSAVY